MKGDFKMAKNSKGEDIKEYPKLIKVEGQNKKVLVKSKKEEDELLGVKTDKKVAWNKQ